MIRDRLALGLLSVLVSGCVTTPSQPSADFVLELPHGVPGTPNVLSIVDEAGIVRSVDLGTDDLVDGNTSIAIARPPGASSSVQVEWLGLMCESQPVLLVERAGNDRLAIRLDHGPSPDSCAAAGIDYRIVLHLDRSVPAEAIEATETSPSRPAD